MTMNRLVHALRVVGSVLLVAALLVTAVVAFPPIVGADHSYVVVSDSMNPSIKAGDVVVVANTAPKRIDSGDVMAFDRVAGDDKRTTHRVVEVVKRDGQRLFRTQGDANEKPDQHLVTADEVIGTVQFTIPYVGWLLSFASSKTGVLVFVAVPGFLLVASELWTMVAAARADASTDENPGECKP